MTDRWWAPQRATTEPDAVVLAMLEPGDLGSALLAAHRAGAAAMETVSKGALPSEERLTGAMVTARANVSDRVVDSVANAVSTPTYAALLVRDVLDDAEQGALAVYRTAVAKGVSPPLAAARASAIYGVPAHALGTYLTLAAIPGSSPAAVADAADRALMTFVSKLVTQEQLVEFSKAPTANHHPEPTISAGWDEKEHPRGPVGQFVRKPPGGGLPTTYDDPGEREAPARPTPQTQAGGPPEAGTLAWLRAKLGMSSLPGSPEKVADVQTPAPTRPTPRKARKARTARRVAPTAAVARTAVTRTADTTRTAQTARIAAAERMAELTRITDAVNLATGSADEDYLEDTHLPTAPDYLRSREKTQSSYDLDPSFSFALDARAAHDFMTTLADQAGGLADPSTRMFRLGFLMDRTGKPEKSTSDDARNNLKHEAKKVTDSDDYQNAEPPDVDVINPQDMRRHAANTEAYITKRKFDWAAGIKSDHPLPVVDQPDVETLKRTKAMPLWKPFGASELDDENRLHDKPEVAIVKFAEGSVEPSIDEFVIDYGAQGEEVGEGNHKDYRLNPNQAYRLKLKPGAKRGERLKPHKLWDGEHNVVVNRWYLQPVDESWVTSLIMGGDIEKAEAFADPPRPIRVPNTQFEHLHPRDENGQFTETETRQSLPSPSSIRQPGTVPRQARKARRARTVRRAAPAPRTATVDRTADLTRTAGAGRTADTARTAMTSALAASSLRHAVETHRQKAEQTAPHEDFPELPILDDRKRYLVLNSTDLAQLLTDHPEAKTSGHVNVGSLWHSVFSRGEMRDGEGVVGALNYNTQQEINDREGPALGSYGWNRKTVGKGLLRPGNQDDEIGMGNMIGHLFATRPEIAQINIEYGEGHFILYGNKEPVQPQALIEVDEEIDWGQPIELVRMGSYRVNEMARRRTDYPGAPLTSAMDYGDPAPANAAASAFLVQNSRVDRYRVQNE